MDEPTRSIGGDHGKEQASNQPARSAGGECAPVSQAATRTLGAGQGTGGLMAGGQFGRYTIVRLLGQGGMGAVYEAQQESPRRSVALKVIRGGWLSAQMLRRFEHESQVLGRLQHPGIAQVYEAGSVRDEGGRSGGVTPFFAMELIKGVPLTEYAAAKNLGTRERLELVARICDAVYHAHQKGVIHRDLKPGNILVDESGQPKILDFGVARATDSDIQQTTMQTDIGQLIGTVPYMSPEQVGGNPDELDTRSDVYALGVIAYELLAGRLPYDLQKKMIHEAVRVIREEDPTRLSAINRTLRGDIETIVAKALEKDKGRRYQSAEALGSDIRRYLKDEPIAARPASTWYQAAKFARRNKVLVGGVAATFLVLVAGIIGVSLMLKRALEAESGLTFQIGETTAALKKATRAEGEATTAKNEAIRERDAAEYEAYVAHLTAADASFLSEQPARVRENLDACPARLRGWEWRYLDALSDTSAATVSLGPHYPIESMSLSPDGELVAFTFGHASVAIRPTRTLEQEVSFTVGQQALSETEFSRDGERLLVRAVYNELTLHDRRTGGLLTKFNSGGVQLYCAKLNAGATRVVVGCKDGCARVFDCESGEAVLRLGGHASEVSEAAWSADGERVATGSRDGGLRLWSKDGELIAALGQGGSEIMCVEFSPDSRLLLTGSRDGHGRLWNAATGEAVADLPTAGLPVFCCAFSADGAMCATAGQHLVVVWRTEDGKEVSRVTSHREPVSSLEFGRNGKRLLTGSMDKTARIFETATGRQLAVLRGHTGSVSKARYLAGGATVLTASSDGTVKSWTLSKATGATILTGHDHIVKDAVFSGDGTRIATASYDDSAKVWDAATGECLASFKQDRSPSEVSFSPDGRLLLVGAVSGPAALIEWETGTVVRRFGGETERAPGARLSADGTRVLALQAGAAAIFDAGTGELLATARPPIGVFATAVLSPDGGRIATISMDGTFRLWNSSDGSAVADVETLGSGVGEMSYSKDGKRIAIGTNDGEIVMRDARNGQVLGRQLAHDERIVGIGFSPDGARVVTASWDCTARVWDSRTLRLLATIRPNTVWVNSACFSPDGERILTGTSDATARIHDTVPVRVRWPIGPGTASK